MASDFYTKLNFCNSEQVYFSFKIQELVEFALTKRFLWHFQDKSSCFQVI